LNPHHEHEFEASPGLPEALPAGERILWQGAPSAPLLAMHALHIRKLAVYFAFMLTVQALYLAGDPQSSILQSVTLSASLAVVCLLLLRAVAWYAARNTLYTLTNRRVVMRIGMVLTVTLNIPLKKIHSASLRLMQNGSGDMALGLAGQDRMGWLHLWPHARAWTFRQPQPCLRCLPKVEQVSALFMKAWKEENPQVAVQWGEAAEHQPVTPVSGQSWIQAS
jgi:hypothetical protein